MDFFYLIAGAAVLLVTFLLHRFGNAWIDRLYASHRGHPDLSFDGQRTGTLAAFPSSARLSSLRCALGLHRIQPCRAFLPAFLPPLSFCS